MTKHTPSPWKWVGYLEGREFWRPTHLEGNLIGPNSDAVLIGGMDCDEESYVQVSREADASLIEAAPDLAEALRADSAFLRQYLLTKLVYTPDSDASGHPHGYSVVQIPDWAVKQRLDDIDAALAKAAVGGNEGVKI
jgi:hypothetical protein